MARAARSLARLVHLAGRQLQGARRLGVVPILVGAVELLRGGVEVAHPHPDLAHLVVGETEDVHQAEALELLACVARILLRARPVAAQHLHLGAVDLADARISADRLPPHPAFGLVGPLPGALQVAHVPAGAIVLHQISLATRRSRRPDDAAAAALSIRATPSCQRPASPQPCP